MAFFLETESFLKAARPDNGVERIPGRGGGGGGGGRGEEGFVTYSTDLEDELSLKDIRCIKTLSECQSPSLFN